MIYTVTLNPALDRELTVPSLAFDDVLRASKVQIDYGGKGFNVSRVLAALGAPSTALGFVGGPSGTVLREGLESLGISTAFVPISGETRTNVSIVAADHSHHIKVNEAGPTITPEEQAALFAQVRELVQPGDWWVLAGSLPPGCPASMYADLITIVQGGGAHAVLDTSGAALGPGCAARPFLVKPNAAEASQLTNRPVETLDEVIAAANALEGIPYVVVSLGKDGALLNHNGASWLALPPTIKQSNPVGAGDSLVAGLVWSLSQGHPPEQVLRWGVASGAATAAKPGTAVGTSEEISSLAEQVSIRQLS